MAEESNPYEAPRQTVEANSGRWQRPALIALLLLAGPVVLGAYFGLGILSTVAIAIALNFAIRHLKRSQAERGASVNPLPYFALSMAVLGGFLLWLRFRPPLIAGEVRGSCSAGRPGLAMVSSCVPEWQ
ncbi:MAG: hypothetical protein JSS27_00255 [Planctomycetes bacterium]|nr:hypothetical protein [Planctomycetota bacterium]